MAMLLSAGLADAQSVSGPSPSTVVAPGNVVAPHTAVARPTVVELYTSEGCSSCPPAEAQIGRLAQRPDVIALAFHVDYWDDLGWRDRFGLPETVLRQRQYARTLHLSSVYTPPLVIDGRRDLVGGGRDDGIASSSAGASASASANVNNHVSLSGNSSPGVPIDLSMHDGSLTIALAAQPQQAACDVVLVGYLAQAASRVTRGENAGRELQEFNIVRSVHSLGSWQGEERTFNVPLTAFAADATGAVVLVQQHDQGPIVGAAARLLR